MGSFEKECNDIIKNKTKPFKIFKKFNPLLFTTTGIEKVAVPPELKKIFTKWASVNPTDYLFFDSFFQPLSSVK